MKNRKWILVVSLVMALAMSLTGTLAYLTDTDEDVNVMTLGNVDIEQLENGESEGGFPEQPLYPAYVKDDGTVVGKLDKVVTVKNIGSSPAYVRTWIAMEAGELTVDNFESVIHAEIDATDYVKSTPQIVTITEEDGSSANYYIVCLTYNKVLGTTDTTDVTSASLKSVYMDPTAGKDEIEAFGEKYEIKVLSQAVQTANMEEIGAEKALVAAFGENHPWQKEDPESFVLVTTGEELREALEQQEKDVIIRLADDIKMEADLKAPYGNKYAVKQDGGVIDGNNKELYMECYDDDYGIMTSGGTIKNLTIKEGCRAVMIMYPTEDVILDNVTIGGDGVLYPINTGEAGSTGVNLTVTNSTLKGWTSFGDSIESASFTNVKFEQGTYYNDIYGRVFRPYVNTTLEDCSFIEHFNLDLSSLTSGHKVTVKNCTVAGQKLTADVITIPSNDAEYDTALFTCDLPSWASSVTDCVIFE